mmetsp:Transcript_51026/g.85375  ORF Transcript_51026/g.85375 Transcript_51026/m.85375 type:complete len:215 (-) Transcript_51026:1775-2419(-)
MTSGCAPQSAFRAAKGVRLSVGVHPGHWGHTTHVFGDTRDGGRGMQRDAWGAVNHCGGQIMAKLARKMGGPGETWGMWGAARKMGLGSGNKWDTRGKTWDAWATSCGARRGRERRLRDAHQVKVCTGQGVWSGDRTALGTTAAVNGKWQRPTAAVPRRRCSGRGPGRGCEAMRHTSLSGCRTPSRRIGDGQTRHRQAASPRSWCLPPAGRAGRQ